MQPTIILLNPWKPNTGGHLEDRAIYELQQAGFKVYGLREYDETPLVGFTALFVPTPTKTEEAKFFQSYTLKNLRADEVQEIKVDKLKGYRLWWD